MKRALAVVFTLLLLGCVATEPKKEAKPLSADEKAIIEIFDNYSTAWEKKDASALLSLLHENATITSGREKNKYSKQEFAKILKGNMAKFTNIRHLKPKITIDNNKAVAKFLVKMNIDGKPTSIKGYTWKLIKEDGKWYIMCNTC